MKRHPVITIALLASVAVATGPWLNAPQAAGKIAMAQTLAPQKFAWPAAVEAAFKKKYPNATVKAVTKETDAGKTVYEVESIDNGRRRDIDFSPDGTIILYEEELTAAEVPQVVLAAVKARYPKATVTMWERLYTIKDNSANYECVLEGAAVSEVILTPDGTWVSPKAAR